MDEVSGRACALILESALERGGTEATLLDGLSFRSDDLRRSHHRIDWDEFTIFLERCRTCLGGMEALDELGALHVGQPWPSLARSLAKGVASAAGLYALGQWNGPANFSCTRVELEKLATGRILQTLEILPGFRDSPEFFYGMRGIIRATPRMLGQPRCRGGDDAQHAPRALRDLTAPSRTCGPAHATTCRAMPGSLEP